MRQSLIGSMFVVFGLAASAAWADGLIVVDRPVETSPGHHRFAPLHVKHHHVTVTIKDQVAVTEIDQVFHNPSDQQLEGTYIFPLPKGGQIDQFAMDVNGAQTPAELLDADKARKIYEDIVRSMRDPALLEYSDRGAFKVRIFPIEPKSDKRVTIQYTQVLKSDTNLIEYAYPLNTEKFSSGLIDSVSVKVDVRTARELKSIYSPSHTVEVIRHGSDRAVVAFEASKARPDTDFQLFYSQEAPGGGDVALDLLTYHGGSQGEDGYFMLLASPGTMDIDSKQVAKDVVFVLDTSGSMAHDGKLDQTKRALQFCLASLNATATTMDRFEVVKFSTEAERLFSGMVDATPENRDKAAEFVKGLDAVGGTAIEESLLAALGTERGDEGADRPFTVIFLTDGRPTVGERNEDKIVASIKKLIGDEARVFCFGLGHDINTHLLDKITEATHAYSEYVRPTEDIEIKVSNFYTKIAHPVLSDLALSVTGDVRLTKVHPHPLPDLFHGQQLLAFGRYAGRGDTAIVLDGKMNTEARKLVQDVTFGHDVVEHAFIPKLWGTRRVGYLLDQIRLHGESDELRDEVVALARTHGIVTPYTSYLIVEDEVARHVPADNRTLQLFGGDDVALREAAGVYHSLSRKSGKIAVDNAAASQDLNRNFNADAVRMSNSMSVGDNDQLGLYMEGLAADGGTFPTFADFGMANSDAAGGNRAGRSKVQRTRFVNGRTFFQNGPSWVDADSQRFDDTAKVIQLKFGSAEYFDLYRGNHAARPWLALGNNVQFAFEGVIYQIVDLEVESESVAE